MKYYIFYLCLVTQKLLNSSNNTYKLSGIIHKNSLSLYIVILTGNVPVAIFQSTEVCHELPHRDLENFKQTRILEKGVCHLGKHKSALLKHQSERNITSTITDIKIITTFVTLVHCLLKCNFKLKEAHHLHFLKFVIIILKYCVFAMLYICGTTLF